MEGRKKREREGQRVRQRGGGEMKDLKLKGRCILHHSPLFYSHYYYYYYSDFPSCGSEGM